MPRVIKTILNFPTFNTKNADGLFTYVEMDKVPLDFLYEQLVRSTVMERRRKQILYPRLDLDAIVGTIEGG